MDYGVVHIVACEEAMRSYTVAPLAQVVCVVACF